VVLEHMDALDIIERHDSPETLFYLDPPYLHETRHHGSERCYAHEMDDDDHVRLIHKIRKISGHVVLSGYDNELYNDCLHGWKKSFKTGITDSGGKRTEVLWLKIPNAADRMRQGAYKTHDARTAKRTRDIKAAIDSIARILLQQVHPALQTQD